MTEHEWIPSETDPRRHCSECGVYEDYGHKLKCGLRTPGRPSVGGELRKARSFKVTDQEWRDMQALADKERISVAELIRRRVLGAD